MGRENNRKFVEIPYGQLLQKLEYKFGKRLTRTEESYTSKCDGLALEKVGKHKRYSGKRIKRGLFASSVGKLINADINGAINIMRKKIKLQKVIGEIFNPIKVRVEGLVRRSKRRHGENGITITL